MRGYTKAVDLWGVGVIMYLLLSGRMPFGDGKNNDTTIDAILKHPLDLSPRAFQTVSEEAKHLLIGLLKKDSALRLTVQQALAHPWFKDLRAKKEQEEEKTAEAVHTLVGTSEVGVALENHTRKKQKKKRQNRNRSRTSSFSRSSSSFKVKRKVSSADNKSKQSTTQTQTTTTTNTPTSASTTTPTSASTTSPQSLGTPSPSPTSPSTRTIGTGAQTIATLTTFHFPEVKSPLKPPMSPPNNTSKYPNERKALSDSKENKQPSPSPKSSKEKEKDYKLQKQKERDLQKEKEKEMERQRRLSQNNGKQPNSPPISTTKVPHKKTFFEKLKETAHIAETFLHEHSDKHHNHNNPAPETETATDYSQSDVMVLDGSRIHAMDLDDEDEKETKMSTSEPSFLRIKSEDSLRSDKNDLNSKLPGTLADPTRQDSTASFTEAETENL